MLYKLIISFQKNHHSNLANMVFDQFMFLFDFA